MKELNIKINVKWWSVDNGNISAQEQETLTKFAADATNKGVHRGDKKGQIMYEDMEGRKFNGMWSIE